MSSLTAKETSLLKDMKNQEMLCVEKYRKAGKEAKSQELKALFSEIEAAEDTHYKTICKMLDGEKVETPARVKGNNAHCVKCEYESDADRGADAFLCSDLLNAEKHVSSVYNTVLFEFCSPENRHTLNHIQSEEQQHGEQIYAYMSANGMYQ